MPFHQHPTSHHLQPYFHFYTQPLVFIQLASFSLSYSISHSRQLMLTRQTNTLVHYILGVIWQTAGFESIWKSGFKPEITIV